DYCIFDPSIVRGLAYYTGIVFEIHDAVGDLRAVCGGGRYDNLLKDFGGTPLSGTGMGMGDCVLEILLREKGLLKDGQISTMNIDYFVAYVDKELGAKAVVLVAKLRSAGKDTDFSYKGGNLKKQLKQASNVNAKKCIIIGREFIDKNELVIKDMASGEQKLVDVDTFLSNL
ncbi:MAG: ATP phosphoribosyltransferase regulatory subunit, partial [Sedimentisphaerales bacterium]|nr:ATP phosphoribosyltransferase regulatory subunit [Sedimentisphaerales bacterium]